MRHPAILARMLFPAQSASGKRSLPYCQRADAICLQSTATSALRIRQRVARHAIASLPDRLELARERSENRTIAFRLIQPGQQECIDQPPDEHYACAPAEYAAPFALRAERFQ